MKRTETTTQSLGYPDDLLSQMMRAGIEYDARQDEWVFEHEGRHCRNSSLAKAKNARIMFIKANQAQQEQAMNEPTSEGKRHIERWERSLQEVRRLKRELNKAECEVSNSTNALGKWLMPNDARVGEVIGVWNGNEIITAKKKDENNYDVDKRKRA
ncbi:MAG: hypothetical protein AAF711_00485 [Planctomycetota bacterium]